MTYVITEACIDVKDQSCIEVCPVDCIYFEEEDRICYVEPDDCIDCGVCESACPVQAIFPLEELARDSIQFIEINSLWFKDKGAARLRVDECG
jgi:NAD-dependent dihydropyrimidine dehydrogenase PreA subunit